jgi:hypothetical protein
MKKDILKRTKTLADYLGWVHPYNPTFHLEWASIMMVYDKITSSDNNRWDIEITNNRITFIDSGKQYYEWDRTNEKTMIELLFYAFSQYVGHGLFNPA